VRKTSRFMSGLRLHFFLKHFVVFYISFIGGLRNIYNDYIFTISGKLLTGRLTYSQAVKKRLLTPKLLTKQPSY
jgi:hypothetical protein